MKSRLLSVSFAVLAALTLSSVAHGQSVFYDTYAMYDGDGVYGYAYVTAWDSYEILLSADAYLYGPDNSLLASNTSDGFCDASAYVYATASQSGSYFIYGDFYWYYYYGWLWLGTSSSNAYVPPIDPVAYYTSPWLSGTSTTITIQGEAFTENPSTVGCNPAEFNINWSVTSSQISGDVWLSSVLTPCELSVIVQGVTVATVQLDLSIPTGEENFGILQEDMAGMFAARLSPGPQIVRFLGRQVQEGIILHDYCYFLESERPQLLDAFHNSSWTTDGFNDYIGTGNTYDKVGLSGSGAQAWVQYYSEYLRDHNSTWCSVSGSQTLFIDGLTPYETHDAGLYLYPGWVFAMRGSATVNIYW